MPTLPSLVASGVVDDKVAIVIISRAPCYDDFSITTTFQFPSDEEVGIMTLRI